MPAGRGDGLFYESFEKSFIFFCICGNISYKYVLAYLAERIDLKWAKIRTI